MLRQDNEATKKWLWSGLAVLTFAAVPSLTAWQEPAAPPLPPAPPALAEMMQLAATTGGSSYLGVGVVEIDKDRARALNLREEYGVEISHLNDDGPAAKGGLKKGDVVLEYNGQRVEGTQQFIRLVRETPAGRNVKLLISRNGATQNVVVTTGTRKNALPEVSVFRAPNAPLPPDFPHMEGFDINVPDGAHVFTLMRGGVLGVEVEPLGPQLAQFFGVKEGLLVRTVTSGSAAEKGGIKAGDVITKIDGAPVANTGDIISKLRPGAAASSKTSTVTVVREKKELSLPVTVEDRRSGGGVAPRARTVTVRNGGGRI